MKRTFFIAILSLTFLVETFAQDNVNKYSLPKSDTIILAQFDDTYNEWYKITAELLNRELLANSATTGLIRFKHDNDKNLTRRLRLIRLGLALNQVDVKRVVFIFVNKQGKDVDVLVASNCSDLLKCEDCIVIRAIDIDKIHIPYKSKRIIKSRKRK